MTIKLIEQKFLDNSHKLYSVKFTQVSISTLVTHSPSYVDMWIYDTERILHGRPHPLVVGLDVEWLPNRTKNTQNPVATIQLCVEHRCLIFQILHSPVVPYSLLNFLGNPSYIFTGVGINEDVKKLMKDYYLVVARTADLRSLAAEGYRERELENSGLKKLARRIFGWELNKAKIITISSWDNQWLTPEQVKYACIDAFLSFEIGKFLINDHQNLKKRLKRQRKRQIKQYKKMKLDADDHQDQTKEDKSCDENNQDSDNHE